MGYFAGTLLASPIVRGSSGDTYGTHHSILGVGGYMEVNSINERDNLPIDDVNGLNYDGISSGQRRIGMLVYVHNDDTIYQLKINKSTWNTLTSNGKLNALNNNSNWDIFQAGSSADIKTEKIFKEFQQTTHGFVVGDVIGFDGTEFTKINANNASIIEPLGIVNKVIDIDTFQLTFSGYINTTTIVDVNGSGLTEGIKYYLSTTNGKLIDIKPTGATTTVKPMLITIGDNGGIVLQYRGLLNQQESGGVTYDLFTGYTATTEPIISSAITGATNVGFFTGYTGSQTLPINHLTNNNFDGNYNSLYNNYYRDSNGVIKIGIPSDNIARRGYLRTSPTPKSWIWNEYTGDTGGVGWIFINDDISNDNVYDSVVTGSSISYDTPFYTNNVWTEGQFYNNGSEIVINSVEGNLLTGDTYNEGGPIFKNIDNRNLNLRTIISKTPEELNVEYDDYYIKLSANTSTPNIVNRGNGYGVFRDITGNTVNLKTLVPSGNTIFIEDDETLTIYTEGGSGTTTNIEKVTKRITQSNHGFSVGDVVGVNYNGNYTKSIADGSYSGETIGVINKVLSSNIFDLTQSGFITGLTSLVAGETYYLSNTVSGGLTTTKPIQIGHVVRPTLIAKSSTTGWVLPYLGDIITSGETASLYFGKSPTTVSVGGINKNTELTGRTWQSIIEEMLVQTLYPDFVAPSNSFNDDVYAEYEVGTELNITFNSTFNRGSITLDGSFQDYRSGLPNTYNYSGTGLTTTVSSTSLSDSQTLNNYNIQHGLQSWGSSVTYNSGPQPLDSEGNPFDSPLPSGTTSQKNVTIDGIYPYFHGVYSSGGAPAGSNRPTPTEVYSGLKTKIVYDSDGQISVNFNSNSDHYIWFAIPEISTSKTEWYISALNNGDIGGAVSAGGNLFPDPEIISISSDTGLWSNVNYKFYISNYQTGIDDGVIMELRNN